MAVYIDRECLIKDIRVKQNVTRKSWSIWIKFLNSFHASWLLCCYVFYVNSPTKRHCLSIHSSRYPHFLKDIAIWPKKNCLPKPEPSSFFSFLLSWLHFQGSKKYNFHYVTHLDLPISLSIKEAIKMGGGGKFLSLSQWGKSVNEEKWGKLRKSIWVQAMP